MFGYIYKTKNTINNKLYIGKRHSSEFIDGYLGSGLLIKRSIEKHGIDNFVVEMIDVAESVDELNKKEIYYISKYKTQDLNIGYNIAAGGDGGNIQQYLSEEEYEAFIEKCRKNSIGKNNPNYGNGDKIRGDKNPAKRPEVRAKISEAVSGEKNGMYGKTHTKESMEQKLKNHIKNHGFFVNQSTKYPKNWRVLDLGNGDIYMFRSKTGLMKQGSKLLGTFGVVMEKIFNITKEEPMYNMKNSLELENKKKCKEHRKFLKQYPNAILYNYEYLEKENSELICDTKEAQIM